MLLVGSESLVSFLLVHVRRRNAKKKSQKVYLFHNLNDLTASNVFGHASERIDSIYHEPYFCGYTVHTVTGRKALTMLSINNIISVRSDDND